MSLFRPLFPEMARLLRAFEDPFFNTLRHDVSPKYLRKNHLTPLNQMPPRLANMDITENDHEYRIYAELPGIDKDQIDIQLIDGNTLKIEGTRGNFNPSSSNVNNANLESDRIKNPTISQQDSSILSTSSKETNLSNDVIRQERFSEEFIRSITFPHRINPNNMEAKYKNGLLEIIIPKETPNIEKVQIQVQE